MMSEKIKVSSEILEEYFAQLKGDESIDKKLRDEICRLCDEKKLNTSTHLKRALDQLREESMNE